MPFALFAAPDPTEDDELDPAEARTSTLGSTLDDDRGTDVLPAVPLAPQADRWPRQPTPTRTMPVEPVQPGDPVARPYERGTTRGARQPYMQPPPLQDTRRVVPGPVPQTSYPTPQPPLPSGVQRLQRGLLLLGLFGLVSVGFALAPYLSLLVLAVVALAVRTFSWTSDSMRARRDRRGRPSWYDGPVAALTTPWYLVVATAGTLMLLLWSIGLACVVGLAYLLFGLPLVPGLLLMGAVLALSAWWGPGSRRLRTPTRRLVLAVSRVPWVGWCAVGLLAVAVTLCAYFLTTSGVLWDPQPGPPWREGTSLGDLVRWL